MNHSRTVRLPVNIIKQLNIMLRALRHEGQQGREPSVTELAVLLEMEPEEVRELLELSTNQISLDTPLDINPTLTIGDMLPDEDNPEPDTGVQEHAIMVYMQQWLSELTDRQREVVERRFGLNGHDPHTLEQVAADIGITRERVRQIQMEAMQSLRKQLRWQGLTRDDLI